MDAVVNELLRVKDQELIDMIAGIARDVRRMVYFIYVFKCVCIYILNVLYIGWHGPPLSRFVCRTGL